MMVTAILLVGVHVDDLLLSGTLKMKEEFMKKYNEACGGLVNWQVPAREFTSMQIKQDTDRGHCELIQEKYWEAAGKRFNKYLPAAYSKHIPVPPKTELKEATDEINEILSKLENKEVDLNSSIEDYKRLIQLNKYIEDQFKKKSKAISLIKNSNNNDKK